MVQAFQSNSRTTKNRKDMAKALQFVWRIPNYFQKKWTNLSVWAGDPVFLLSREKYFLVITLGQKTGNILATPILQVPSWTAPWNRRISHFDEPRT
jgi:hypothetical protein